MGIILGSIKTEIKPYYTAQITVNEGLVYAEILKSSNEGYPGCTNDYMYVIRKSFGSIFRKQPREKDYINANKYISEQLELLKKYTTEEIKIPKYVYECLIAK